MNMEIRCFSATGNTRMIGDRLKEEYKKQKQPHRIDKLIGIGFPCYEFSYPKEPVGKIIAEVQALHRQTPVKVFLYATFCLNPGTSLDEVHRELDRAGIPVLEKFGFHCPSPGFYAISTGREKGIKGAFLKFVCSFSRKQEDQIKKAIEGLNGAKRKKFHHLAFAAKSILNYPRRRFAHWNEHRLFHDYKIDKEKCQKCFRCITKCPVHNITFSDDTIQFVNSNDCLRCMSCISYCPGDGITLGLSTEGMRRYNINAVTDRNRQA